MSTPQATVAQTIEKAQKVLYPAPFQHNNKFRKTPGGGFDNIQRTDVTQDFRKKLSKQRPVNRGSYETTGVVTAQWTTSEETFIFALKIVPIPDDDDDDDKRYNIAPSNGALSDENTQDKENEVDGSVNSPLRASEQLSVESILGQFSKTSPPSDKEDDETEEKNGPDNTLDKEPLKYLTAHWYRELAFYQKGYTHPHLLYLHGYSYIPRSIHFYLEIMECSLRELRDIYGTDLFKTEDGPVKEQAFCAYLKHELSGLSFLHECSLMHRDIKDSNTLVKVDEAEGRVVIKLSDFGTVKGVNDARDDRKHSGNPGTIQFEAPEVQFDGNYTQACDLWSIAVTAYLLLKDESISTTVSDSDPDSWRSSNSIFRQVTGNPNNTFTHVFNDEEGLSEKILAHLGNSLDESPEKRPSAQQFLEDIKDTLGDTDDRAVLFEWFEGLDSGGVDGVKQKLVKHKEKKYVTRS